MTTTFPRRGSASTHPRRAGDDLDEPAELAFYCPACAEREFGDDA